MAYRTWGRVLLAALGVGLLAGAGQLGFAYGLGVVRFARDFEQSPGQWTAHLTWVAWFAMLAAVAGALAGSWLAARDDLRPTLGSRVAVSLAGGIGALAVAPLAMLPSRVASIGSGSPVTIAGLSAVLGALVGVFAAVAVLSQRVAGLNLGAVTVVVWLVALLSVAPSLGPDDPLPEVRLGVLDATWLGEGLAQRLAVIVMPGIALAAGAGIGALARWRGLPVIAVAVSGVVGPALLALAYLIAGPGDDADRYQAAPYWGALIAVAAGGLGSVLAAVARQLTAERPEPGPVSRHGDHTAEVFPGYRGDDTAVATGPKPPAGRAEDDDEPTRTGFDSWGSDKPTPSDPDNRWGDDKPTSSFSLDSPPAGGGDDLFTRDDRGPLGGSASNAFGRGGRDPLGGSASDTGASRASHLGDVRRSGPSRAGDGPAGGSLFNPPTPVAPPRQPEIVSPPPISEPTPVRPFDRQPAAGPGDWRTDKTSTFSTPSVPVVPANGPERRDDGDFPQRPTSIRPQPTVGRVPRQPGEADGLAPIDLPAQPGAAWPATADPVGRPGQAGLGRHGGPGRSDDPAQTSGAGSAGWSDRSGWSGGPPPPAGRPATAGAAAQTSEEMPDWRLAPPAWTPPPPITPGEPASGTGVRVDAAPAEAVPAKAPTRRGLFRRKNKSEPPAAAETSDAGWVEVTAPAGTAPDEQPSTDDPSTGDNSPGGPRGFGFGRLVSGRFGGTDQTAEPAGSWAERDAAADDPRRDAGTVDRDTDTRSAGHTLGASDSRTGAQDEGGRRSWADRARADDDGASGDSVAPAKDRAGKKSGRAERHLRSVDLGDDQPARTPARGDSDAGSWDIDDPTPPTRGSGSTDDVETDDASTSAGSTPSRGLFRRNRNNSDAAETRPDQDGDDAPEPSRGRRGKGDKPIQERDEEYVDWVTGLSAPEPVNERRRDDVPRRSLRPTTRRKDE